MNSLRRSTRLIKTSPKIKKPESESSDGDESSSESENEFVSRGKKRINKKTPTKIKKRKSESSHGDESSSESENEFVTRGKKINKKTPSKIKKRKSESSYGESSVASENEGTTGKKSSIKSPIKKVKLDKPKKEDDDSSGSSSSEELFQNPKNFDFKSEFFTSLKSNNKVRLEKEKEEEEIIASRLSDSEDDSDFESIKIENSNEISNDVQVVSNHFANSKDNKKKSLPKRKTKIINGEKIEKRKGKNDRKEEELSISQILALGETMNIEKNEIKEDRNKTKEVENETKRKKIRKKHTQSSDEEDWEEVDELKKENLNAPTRDIEIKIEKSDLAKRKKGKSKQVLFEEELRRHLNRKIRDVQVLKHKVHLLCLIAYGQLLNNHINCENVMAIALSLLPSQYSYPKDQVDLKYGKSITSWFFKNIKFRENSHNHRVNDLILEKNFTNKTACCKRELVLMFVSLLRAIGLKARLVISLQPVPLRPKTEDLCSLGKKSKVKKGDSDMDASSSIKNKSIKKMEPKQSKKPENKKNLKSEKKSKNEKGTKKQAKGKTKNTKTKNKTNDSSDDDETKFISKNDRSVLSSSDEDNKPSTSTNLKYCDYWAELFLEDKEIWICLDPTSGNHDCISHIYKQLTPPVTYILAFNNDLSLKDVTKRYDPLWLTITQKKRIENDWWDKTLKPFAPPKSILEEIEERHLILKLENKPLPKSITEYKDHPLYALKRHLLQYEVLYPNDCIPIGYVKSEPVYRRESVFTCCSREKWLKEAKVVKMGEEPYTIVKRPKWDKLTRTILTKQPLEVFGPWQVEDYVPPEAKDGIVPRNCYGNVDLFKPSMLPKGTVHIHGNNLNRVARKLGIDCAPAITGFDFHSGGVHALVDGYVVCEEFKDTLLNAWRQEMVEAKKRQEERRQKVIYDRWKLLIKGLIIRERLKLRYDLGKAEPQNSNTEIKKVKSKKKENKRKTT